MALTLAYPARCSAHVPAWATARRVRSTAGSASSGSTPKHGDLQIGRAGSMERVEQLRHPGAPGCALPRHVRPLAAVDGALHVVREGEHLGDLGEAANGRGLRGGRA